MDCRRLAARRLSHADGGALGARLRSQSSSRDALVSVGMIDIRILGSGRALASWLAVIGGLAAPVGVRAACNAVPTTTETIRAAVGSVSRPFARSSGAADDVELLPSCDSPALEDANGDGAVDGKDFFVSVFFKPPGSKGRLVVLSGGAGCGDLQCGGKAPHCVDAPGPYLVVNKETGRLRFRFPETDGLLGPAGDGRGLTGPVAIAVTAVGKPLPCGLRTSRCIAQPGSPKQYFCIDDLFVDASGPAKCDTGRASQRTTFAGFTALPASNDYRRVCGDSEGEPRCADDASSIQMTVDSAGNVGLPMRWGSALRARPGDPGRKDNRRLKASTVESRARANTKPIDVPNSSYLASFTPEGRRWDRQPLFAPVAPGRSGRSRELTLEGTADEPESVLWFHRRLPWRYECKGGARAGQACAQKSAPPDCPGGSCRPTARAVYYTCHGGKRSGAPCTRGNDCGANARCMPGSRCVAWATGTQTPKGCSTDADCSAAEECGPGLFEFRDRMTAGGGPIVVDRDGSPSRPGVCRTGPKKGEACTSANECEGKRCVRFRAQAGAYTAATTSRR